MALRVANAKRWPCPSRSHEIPASGRSTPLPGDGAGERGAHAQALSRGLESVTSVALMDARASRPTGPARPVSQMVPAGRSLGEAGQPASTSASLPVTTEDRAKRLMPVPPQARPEHVFDASRRQHMPVLQHHDARGEPRHLIDGMRHVNAAARHSSRRTR